MNNFYDKFLNKSNAELLKIIQNSNDYRKEAVQSAKDIIESRKLSQDEIDNAKEEIKNQRLAREKEKLIKKEADQKIKEKGLSIVDPINPLKSNLSGTERSIRILTILIGLILLYGVFETYGTITYQKTDKSSVLRLSELLFYILPLTIIAIGLVLFHKRNRNGWTIFTSLFTLTTSLSFMNLLMAYTSGTNGNYYVDSLFPSSTSSLGGIFINGACLWFLCRENTRNAFSVSKNWILPVLGFILIILISFFLLLK